MDNPFTPPILQRYKEFLEHFPGTRVIKSDTEAIVQCPDPDNRHSHGDRDPSLGVDLRVNGHGPEILLHCRSQECKRKKILRAVGLSDRDRFLEEGVDAGALPGCTLEEYAAYKNLPVEFLAGDTVGLEDSTRWCPVTRREVNAVLIPYFDEEGNEIDNCARYRT